MVKKQPHFDERFECPIDEHEMIKVELLPELLNAELSLLERVWVKQWLKQHLYSYDEKMLIYDLQKRYFLEIKS